MMADHEIPVLIVGGSLVGMSTALLLGHYGVRALAVEHHRGTAIHPRAAQISQRTMEILRTVGVEQIVRQRSGEQFVQGKHILLDAKYGKGHVILFGFRPQFRGQSFGTFKFLLNAIYLGSARAL